MRTWRERRALLAIPFRSPTLLMLSVAYAGLLHAAGSQAGLLDIRNPYWVLSAGGLLLFSPVYHTLILAGIASVLREDRVDWRGGMRGLHDPFAGLFVGEIVVGLAVIAGGFLLLIPGVYIGMRLIYYKQAIVFEGHSVSGALRESVRRTANGRATLGLFAILAALYGCAVGVDTLLVAFASAPVLHGGGIVSTALLLTWMNIAVTAAYAEQAAVA